MSAASNMLFSVPQTISIAAGAALITLIDYRIEIGAVLVVLLLAGAYLLTRRSEDEDDVDVDVELAHAA